MGGGERAKGRERGGERKERQQEAGADGTNREVETEGEASVTPGNGAEVAASAEESTGERKGARSAAERRSRAGGGRSTASKQGGVSASRQICDIPTYLFYAPRVMS